jgi:hypothetical protein
MADYRTSSLMGKGWSPYSTQIIAEPHDLENFAILTSLDPFMNYFDQAAINDYKVALINSA